MKGKMIFVLSALLAMIAVCGLPAQVNLPGAGAWSSPQFQATQGRVRSNADNVMRADAYVKPSTWFGYTSYAATNRIAAGFAATAGDLYLGVHYFGSLWTGYAQNNYTEQTVGFFGSDKEYPVYAGPATNANSYNTAAILIGIGDMGIRFAYHSTHQSFNKDEIAVGDYTAPPLTFYKNYKTESGSIHPQIIWAMTKNLTDNGIKPYFGVNMEFVRNNTEYDAYTSASASSGRDIASSQNYFAPVFTAGLGGYTFFKQNGFSLSADLEYALTLRLYNNEYNYGSAGDFKYAKIKGLYTGAAFTENSYSNNAIRPVLSGSWTKDNLALRFRFRPMFNFANTGVTTFAGDADFATKGSLQKAGAETDTAVFTFSPTLELGAQWKIIPKIALNAGALVNSSLTLTTIEGRTYAAGVLTPGSEYTTKNTAWGNTDNALSLGFSFFATDNLTFEVSSGIGASNTVNVFDTTDGLFRFTNVMISLSF
jgi:hypothetical protein